MFGAAFERSKSERTATSLVDPVGFANNFPSEFHTPILAEFKNLTMPSTRASLPPISTAAATVLILGSMPGERSLRASQYYAHPQNAFWGIMGHLTGLDPRSPYEQRIAAMNQAGIALWDVIHSCDRPGSLDGDILPSSIKPNDFLSFFRDHPQIELVCFNGATAAQCFQRRVMPSLGPMELQYLRVPSTSPAHTISFARKAEAWSAIAAYLNARIR